MIVAIDGPAGAGKSTVARLVAEALGLDYLDTGAMYRAVALAVLEAGLEVNDRHSVGGLAGELSIEARGSQIFLNGKDVTDRIRDPDVTAAVSIVAADPEVRKSMVAQQRAAAASGVVMEGRDIGSAVVPDAELKIFLTASLAERATRRWKELGDEDPASLARIEASIAARDNRDSERDTSPLVKTADAIEVDTTGRSIEDIVDEIVAHARRASDVA